MGSMMMRAAVVAAALAIFSPALCQAGAPQETVKKTIDSVIDVLKDPSLKGAGKETQRQEKIKEPIYAVFDFEEMAKRSLARHWRDRSPAEKKEFTKLFADLLECSYISRIESYQDEKIVFDSEKIDEDYAVVKSKFVTKRREEISVDYKLFLEDGKWKVYDVVIENVSLVNNYRIQFNKIISGSSYGELVKKMQTKAESEAIVCPPISGI